MATRIQHASGLRVDVAPDASGLPRPQNITASWPGSWPGSAEESKNLLQADDPLFVAQGVASLGAHRYDGSGNVRARGAEWTTFDGANRLTTYNLGSGSSQSYRFDSFGNLNRITTDGVHRTLPILTASNRLAAGAYDAVGNLTAWAGETYGFDVLDRMQTRNFPERTHIFTVDGERLFTFDWNPQSGQITERWTLRDLDGSVLTAYETEGGNAGTWRWSQDYVYRSGTMLASRVRFDDESIGVRDYVVDHLGTPRLIGDRHDGLRTQHFFGFGEPTDLAASRSDPERKRFTGHERDLGTLAGSGGVQVELDYMRARFHSPWTARFLSVDPARASVYPQRPQTWNRYSYVTNNPLYYIDPDGLELQAYFLATGAYWDPLRHSAIYIHDTDPDQGIDMVFTHGGAADGRNTLQDYLSTYEDQDAPTVFHQLWLKEEEIRLLLQALKEDFNETGELHKMPDYNLFTNNCAQYACSEILKVSSAAARGKTILSTNQIHVEPPVLFTNQAIAKLITYGALGDAKRLDQTTITFFSRKEKEKEE